MNRAAALVGLTLLLLRASPLAAETPTPNPTPAPNPEMKRLYDADQADRAGEVTKIDWTQVGPRDAERRQQTRRLMAAGGLRTGADFLEAAYVFQHGDGDDFLLAHTLAIIATEKGDRGAPWIAAATLDRYLQSAGHKQIYGTQRSHWADGWTNEPYDRSLISDALRRELGVPDLAAQAAQLEKLKAQSDSPTAKPTTQNLGATKQITCDIGLITRVYVRATWRISSCTNGGLLVTGGGEPAASIAVFAFGGKVIATPQAGGDQDEVKVVKAALEAMIPAQIADIVAQTKASHP